MTIDRLSLAYLMIAAVILTLAAIVAFKLYHSQDRTYRRRRLRSETAYEARMAEQGTEGLAFADIARETARPAAGPAQ